jgi:hypothetical protein
MGIALDPPAWFRKQNGADWSVSLFPPEFKK